MNTVFLYYLLRALQLLIGGTMLHAYFTVRTRQRLDHPITPEVLLGLDILFISSILLAAWITFAPIIKPLKKQLKEEAMKRKAKNQ